MRNRAPDPSLEFVFPPEVEHLRVLRRNVRHRLEACGASVDLTDTALLVLDEIITNAIEHASDYRADGVNLVVRLQIAGPQLSFEFEDPDVPTSVVHELAEAMRSQNGSVAPPPDFERGRGLFLIVHGVEDLVVGERPDGGLHVQGRIGAESA